MNDKKKPIFRNLLFFIALGVVFPAVYVAGCASSKAKTAARAEGSASDTVAEDFAASVAFLVRQVDTLSGKFMMMPGSRQVPAGIEEKWSSLSAEAERLGKSVMADPGLDYARGELGRIGIFFNIPDAAQTAEYFLSQCVGLGGGLEDRGYRQYYSLAWLNLHNGCQLSEKTAGLLAELDKRAPDWEEPYIAMLKGYYYYSCRHEPAQALPYFQEYLAFDPLDQKVLKTCEAILKDVRK